MAVALDGAALVASVVAFEELLRKVIDQLADLLGLPAILTLVVVDGELGASEKGADVLGVAADLSQGAASPMISPIAQSPYVWNNPCVQRRG